MYGTCAPWADPEPLQRLCQPEIAEERCRSSSYGRSWALCPVVWSGEHILVARSCFLGFSSDASFFSGWSHGEACVGEDHCFLRIRPSSMASFCCGAVTLFSRFWAAVVARRSGGAVWCADGVASPGRAWRRGGDAKQSAYSASTGGGSLASSLWTRQCCSPTSDKPWWLQAEGELCSSVFWWRSGSGGKIHGPARPNDLGESLPSCLLRVGVLLLTKVMVVHPRMWSGLP
jgi:hypothetical protein